MNSLFLRRVSLKSPIQPSSYLKRLPIVACLEQDGLCFERPVTFFVGENGSGKSTLLEAIAVAFGFNAEGGGKSFRFSTAETHSALASSLLLTKGARMPRDGFFLRAESFYNLASYLDGLGPEALRAYGDVSLHAQSHGENFLTLVNERFSPNGLYILDEPEAALSPTRQMALLARIHALAASGSQFLIATHSPMLMACPGATVYQLDENGIRPCSYTETEHYIVMRSFLNQPQRMLDILLNNASGKE